MMFWQVIISTNSDSIAPAEMGVFLLLFIKWCMIILAIFYLAFSGVMIRQIQLMRQTLMTSFSPYLKILGFAHFGLALFVLFAFILIL